MTASRADFDPAVLMPLLSGFAGRRVLCVGDVMIDRSIYGEVRRISPEAPVPIVLQEESFYTPGGAANVANNLVSLGADVILVSKIGDDICSRLIFYFLN